MEDIYNQGKLPYLTSVGPLHHLTDNQDCFNNICMATVTKPQHATMLTGCLADLHGVYSNTLHQLIPDGITVFELIKAAHPEYKTALISGKQEHVGEPTFGNIVADVDFFKTSDLMIPRESADIAIDLIKQWKNNGFFIFCHFKRPDVIGHRY